MEKHNKEKVEEKKEKIEVASNLTSSESKKIKSVGSRKKITISKNILIAVAVVIAVAIVGALFFYYKGLLIAATINGSPISRLAVISELEKTSGKKILESLVIKKLIDDEARAKGIVIASADIDAEIKTIEEQIKAQGATLDQALTEQGITLDFLKNQIAVQKKLENLLADQVQVSDADITKYIADNKVTIPAGEEATYKEQIKSQLKQQKLSDAATAFIESLRTKSKINYFVNY